MTSTTRFVRALQRHTPSQLKSLGLRLRGNDEITRPAKAQFDLPTVANIGGTSMPFDSPILVTGAAGHVGGVGRTVVELLCRRNLPVRALVRREDERAAALRATGAEGVVGDLLRAADVALALAGCRRIYFGMSASAPYLEATVTAAAVRANTAIWRCSSTSRS